MSFNDTCGRRRYNTIQYNTIQYNTIQYNTIQYNTIQYNTIQYNTIKIYLNTVKSFNKKKTKTDLQDCRVGVTIDIDKDNNHL